MKKEIRGDREGGEREREKEERTVINSVKYCFTVISTWHCISGELVVLVLLHWM